MLSPIVTERINEFVNDFEDSPVLFPLAQKIRTIFETNMDAVSPNTPLTVLQDQFKQRLLGLCQTARERANAVAFVHPGGIYYEDCLELLNVYRTQMDDDVANDDPCVPLD